MTDGELLQQAKRGSQDAYGELVSRHQAWLVRLLRYIVADSSAAQDVAQDAFTRAYLALGRCPPDANFRAWIRVIATRLAFNLKRDARTRRERQAEAVSSIPPPPTMGERTANRELILKLLSLLSASDREILVFRYLEELSIKEIADALQLGESAVKMRLKRARTELMRHHERSQSNDR